MKKLISLALVCIMLLCILTACDDPAQSNQNGQSPQEQSKLLLGTWVGEVHYAEYFNQGLKSVAGEALAEYWTVEDFSITLIMTFREDGTYSITVDRDKLNVTVEALKVTLTAGLRSFIQDLIAASESTLSVDEFMAENNISPEGLIADAIGPDVVESIINENTYNGNYIADDGKLYTSAALAYDVNTAIYENYQLVDNTLTFTSIVGGSGTSLLNESLYPFTLIRTN